VLRGVERGPADGRRVQRRPRVAHGMEHLASSSSVRSRSVTSRSVSASGPSCPVRGRGGAEDRSEALKIIIEREGRGRYGERACFLSSQLSPVATRAGSFCGGMCALSPRAQRRPKVVCWCPFPFNKKSRVQQGPLRLPAPNPGFDCGVACGYEVHLVHPRLSDGAPRAPHEATSVARRGSSGAVVRLRLQLRPALDPLLRRSRLRLRSRL